MQCSEVMMDELVNPRFKPQPAREHLGGATIPEWGPRLQLESDRSVGLMCAQTLNPQPEALNPKTLNPKP